jgi:LCP family protein required for cell wall assembly
MTPPSYPVDPSAPLPPHLDPRRRSRGGRRRGARRAGGSGRRTALRLAQVTGTLLSVGLLVLAGYVWLTYRSIDKGVHRLPVAVNAPPSGKQDIDGTDQNILLVGNDDRSNMTDAEVRKLKVGRGSGSRATDTMMIVHVPADGSRATLISLPRDTYVTIPGHGKNKLNSAYLTGYNETQGTDDQKRGGGADLLIRTITNLTGLTINHYVQVSLMGFYDISNAIGGVDVTLCHDVNDTVAYNRSIGSDGGSGLVLSKGKHTIKGVQALEFVRQRHNLPNGDLDRVRRQQYFLTAAFRRVASVNLLFKLSSLGDALKRNVYMDSGLKLTDLARQMEKLSANNIVGRTIPFERFENTEVGSVEIVSPRRVQAFVQRLITATSPGASPSASPKAGSAGSSASGPTASSATGTPTRQAIDAKCIN